MKRLVVLGSAGLFLALCYVGVYAQAPDRKEMPKYIATIKDKDKDAKARISACKAIGDIGRLKASYAKDAVEPLTMLVKEEKDTKVRAAAITALGAIDPDDKDAVTAIIDTLKNEKDKDLQVACITALGLLGAKAKDALPVLKELQAQAKADKDKKIGKVVGTAVKSIQAQSK